MKSIDKLVEEALINSAPVDLFPKFTKIYDFPKFVGQFYASIDPDYTKISVTEKVDGSNFRFAFIGSKLVFGSRKLSPPAGGFDKAIRFLFESINYDKLDTGYIYFAEATIEHKIKYEDIPPMLGIAVYDTYQRKYLPDWKEMFEDLNLPSVHSYSEGHLTFHDAKAIVDRFLDKASQTEFQSHYSNEIVEGLVFSDYTNDIFMKAVREDFREMKAISKPKPRQIDPSLVMTYVQEYITPTRIDKMLAKLKHGEVSIPQATTVELAKLLLTDAITETTFDELSEIFANELPQMMEVIKCYASDCGDVLYTKHPLYALLESHVQLAEDYDSPDEVPDHAVQSTFYKAADAMQPTELLKLVGKSAGPMMGAILKKLHASDSFNTFSS